MMDPFADNNHSMQISEDTTSPALGRLELPGVVRELSNIHKGQTWKLRNQKQTSENLKVQLEQAKENYDTNLRVLSELTQQLNQCETQKKLQECTKLEKDISELLKMCQNVQMATIFQTKFVADEKELIKRSQKLMQEHKLKANKLWCNQEDELNLEKQKLLVQSLKEKWKEIEAREDTDAVLSGLAVKEKEEECDALKEAAEKKVIESQEIKSQVEELKKELQQLELSISVLHKRNKAQLIRLKKQFNVMKNQNANLKEQESLLNKQIIDMQQGMCVKKENLNM
ncbi:synaptonemal complex protein 1-like [Octopus sinensis]|uniref:Synaptonemal complex protein 1-like n=1 Tax=Octopus sinensis TaxID=2607531 RepID=A0A6P7S4L0_9MOLL|nr:synaptonemal complex protein 1-like [Octopus sinensis]